MFEGNTIIFFLNVRKLVSNQSDHLLGDFVVPRFVEIPFKHICTLYPGDTASCVSARTVHGCTVAFGSGWEGGTC